MAICDQRFFEQIVKVFVQIITLVNMYIRLKAELLFHADVSNHTFEIYLCG